ncbi:GtrA family protein [Qipengyuania nanhaisediminis]|uniref:GtrA family protein n=1 Tax=Qipengyuania nanhaisediminis TaxID=604088 RepID=UPI000B84CC1D
MIGRLLAPYSLISGLCVILHWCILLAGEKVSLHFTVSITLSFVICLIIGYGLHSRFTFKKKRSRRSFFLYGLTNSLNYPISLLTIWFFYDFLKQPMMLAAPASTLILVVYNFFSSKWAIGNASFAFDKQGIFRERS